MSGNSRVSIPSSMGITDNIVNVIVQLALQLSERQINVPVGCL